MKSTLLLLLFAFFYSTCLIAQPTIQWQKSLGGTGDDWAISIQQTSDSGYIVSGFTTSNDSDVSGNHGGEDDWVVKLNRVGGIQWQECLGGTGDDLGYSIQQTSDSGYIIAGYSNSNDSNVTGDHGQGDYFIVKLNTTGLIQWQKCFGGTQTDDAKSIKQLSNGDYIIAGYSYSNDSEVTGNHGTYDYWVVRIDGIGNILWQKCLGGSNQDLAYSIDVTSEGGFIVAGYSESNDSNVTGNHGFLDAWVVKIDSAGTIQWEKSFGGVGDDGARSIKHTNDGGYIFAGYADSSSGNVTGNHGSYDYWVVKLDSLGTIQWEKSLGGTGDDEARSIEITSDEGYIIAGYSDSNDGDVTGNHGGKDFWIVKLDSTGIIQWEKSLGGAGDDEARSIKETYDGGYIVAGYSDSTNGDVTGTHGSYDYWIVKLSPVILGIDEIKNTLSNLQIIPNPVAQSTTISFSLSHSEKIVANIYDITGRLIKNIFDGYLAMGEHKIVWKLNDENIVDDGIISSTSKEKTSLNHANWL